RPLVPDLRELVVAKLAVGIADQVGHIGEIIMAEGVKLSDRRSVVVLVVDRGVGFAVGFRKGRIVEQRLLVSLRLVLRIRRRRRFLGGRSSTSATTTARGMNRCCRQRDCQSSGK